MQLEQWLSPLGIASALLFISGVSLIAWNVFRTELTFEDKRRIMTVRESTLPNIISKIGLYLNRVENLARDQTLYQLEIYQDKLQTLPKLWRWLESAIRFQKKHDAKGALYSEIKAYFTYDNEMFAQIKQDDDLDGTGAVSLIEKISNDISQISNNRLSILLNRLYKAEHVANSFAIFCKLSRNQFNPDLWNEKALLYEEKAIIRRLHKAQEKVNRYIYTLLRGEDL